MQQETCLAATVISRSTLGVGSSSLTERRRFDLRAPLSEVAIRLELALRLELAESDRVDIFTEEFNCKCSP